MIYLLTAIGLAPGGSSTVNIYTQTVHRTIQKLLEKCGPCPVFASYTLVFALQLRKKHGKTSVSIGIVAISERAPTVIVSGTVTCLSCVPLLSAIANKTTLRLSDHCPGVSVCHVNSS